MLKAIALAAGAAAIFTAPMLAQDEATAREPRVWETRGQMTADGERKRAFETVGNAFEPVQAILNGPPEKADGVAVCNDSRTPVEGTLSWSVVDSGGASERTDGSGPEPDGTAAGSSLPPVAWK